MDARKKKPGKGKSGIAGIVFLLGFIGVMCVAVVYTTTAFKSAAPTETPPPGSQPGETQSAFPYISPSVSPPAHTDPPSDPPSVSPTQSPQDSQYGLPPTLPPIPPPPLGNLKPSGGERDGWMLTLVNRETPFSEDDAPPSLEELPNGLKFDSRAIGALNAMLDEMTKQGLSPVVCSAYRTLEKQTALFEGEVTKNMDEGLSRAEAVEKTMQSVAYPGTSEHHLGLAADIVSLEYQRLTERQAETPEVKWLLKHCAEYGFILRYPAGKEHLTGIVFEPWHFRYVGVTAAKEISENGLCLEEYLS
ncbi:MAG: M15 family metallopeptidase [Oscillospiraceae bacterium]|jgi:D-alanyl-D-alanine carboxypeptidase|nr:M15 family metallopeptidase [Oscillospiraceae bacterium]